MRVIKLQEFGRFDVVCLTIFWVVGKIIKYIGIFLLTTLFFALVAWNIFVDFGYHRQISTKNIIFAITLMWIVALAVKLYFHRKSGKKPDAPHH
jgi:hypothetical protein